MKKLSYTLFAVFYACLLTFGAQAGSAKFTWVIPDPAFDDPVPADWIIDEYRIYCTSDPGNGQPKVLYNQVVYGYTTDRADYDDVPTGFLECYMTSWSIKANAESIPSNIVSKFVLGDHHPNPPTDIDFTPEPPAPGASLIPDDDPVARAQAKRERQMERRRQSEMNSGNRFDTQH